MKQETLEEFAKIFVKNRFSKQICGDESYPDILASKSSIVESHILFAKWQQEITYSEELEKEQPKHEYQSECICDTECRGFVNVKCKKPKQETLEEFINEELEDVFFTNISKRKEAERLIEMGAKWQQETLYSEEEVLGFGKFCVDKIADFLDGKGDQTDGKEYSMEELLEQFKKA